MDRTTMTRKPRSNAALTAGLATVAGLALLAPPQSANAAPGTSDRAERSSATPYVVQRSGEETARTSTGRRPERLVLSEFTSVHDVNWARWDARRAVGAGLVTGSWCLSTCMDKPLKATLRLADPRTVDGRKVYSTFTLTLADGSGSYDAEDLRGKRPLAVR
ncbi:hypothetical protein RCO28_08975 [Streptomyces sp. LHD-70]|uniref:hypothetical protein n=1 Tax=Streptomyces sp. LHD-70 TaxID=3072140 RepID=UPI0028100EC0|nr:hypothetical protein [Streptomyces sp. LHD-70]MDQ8702618.1 hypothetical protein [Streptomyces sp. LHD-70]